MVSDMNDYSFGVDPRIKEIIELLQQAKQNQQQQEPPTGTQYADASFQKGNEARNAAWQQQTAAAMSAQPTPETQQAVQAIQQQPQQQLTTPEQWRLMNQITEQKGIHEGADAIAKAVNPQITDGAQLDAIANSLRTGAHNNADLIRQIAKETGIDLSGIEDVSYADAQRNLQTRQTKEVADILSGRGKYGRNSDQYYNDMYMQFISEGKSDRQAKRLAGQFAQRYQYDRVTYLRNAYNMYGRDGNYTNEDGVPILQEIAMEMPDVAGVYANAYKLPTHLQDRADTLEDKAIAQANSLEQIAAQTEGNSRLQAEQGVINEGLKKLGGEIEKGLIGARGEEERRTISHTQRELFERFKLENNFTKEQAENAWWDKLDALEKVGVRMGLKGDDLNSFIAMGAGINIRFGKDGKVVGKVSDESAKNVKDLLERLTAYRNSLITQLKGDGGFIDYESNPQLVRQLATVDEQIESLNALGIEGITGTESVGKGKGSEQKLNLTGNLDNDAPIFEALRDSMKRQGFSTEQIRKGLYDIAIEHGYKPEYAQSALGLSKDEVAKWHR